LKLYANPELRVPLTKVAVGFGPSLTFVDAITVLVPLIAWTRYPRAPPSGLPIARLTVVSQIDVTARDVGAAKFGVTPLMVNGALDKPFAKATALNVYVVRFVSPLITPTTEVDVAKSVVCVFPK
jgi:hypothetical protein